MKKLKILLGIMFILALQLSIAETIVVEGDAVVPDKPKSAEEIIQDPNADIEDYTKTLVNQQDKTDRILGTVLANIQNQGKDADAFLQGVVIINQTVSLFSQQLADTQREMDTMQRTIERQEALLEKQERDMKWYKIKVTALVSIILPVMWFIKNLIFAFKRGKKFPHIKKKIRSGVPIYFGAPDIKQSRRDI